MHMYMYINESRFRPIYTLTKCKYKVCKMRMLNDLFKPFQHRSQSKVFQEIQDTTYHSNSGRASEKLIYLTHKYFINPEHPYATRN